ncbi:MAG TPA: hypothetical protein DEB56_08260 [Thiobacillus sp.]|nr:hypothetical protein [Thiobacillus sp.]
MTTGTKVTNDGPPGKYFTMLLNMADDDLDPFEYRLLGHYIRVCGAGKDGSCFETTRTTAEKTRMSRMNIQKARDSLREHGWIRFEKGKPRQPLLITIVDRMAENVARYAGQNLGQSEGTGPDLDQTGPDLGQSRQDGSGLNLGPKKNYKDLKTKEEDSAPPEADAVTPEKPEASAPKPRPRDPLFDIVAECSFGYPAGSPRIPAGGRIGTLVSYLKGHTVKPYAKAPEAQWIAGCNPPATAEEVTHFYGEHGKITIRNITTFDEYFQAWRAQKITRPLAPITVTHPDPTCARCGGVGYLYPENMRGELDTSCKVPCSACLEKERQNGQRAQLAS